MFRRKSARTKTKPLTNGPTVLSDRDLAGVAGGTSVPVIGPTGWSYTYPKDRDGTIGLDDT